MFLFFFSFTRREKNFYLRARCYPRWINKKPMSVTAQGRDSSYPYSHPPPDEAATDFQEPASLSFCPVHLSSIHTRNSACPAFLLPDRKINCRPASSGVERNNGAGQRRVERIAKKRLGCGAWETIESVDLWTFSFRFHSRPGQTLPALMLPDVRRCVCQFEFHHWMEMENPLTRIRSQRQSVNVNVNSVENSVCVHFST